jgi:hypothetical protein
MPGRARSAQARATVRVADGKVWTEVTIHESGDLVRDMGSPLSQKRSEAWDGRGW